MSTATIDSPADTARRSAAPRPRTGGTPPGTARPAEAAAAELVSATAETVRAFAPAALTRPTHAVETAFELAEQGLAAARRVCLELAALVEDGVGSAARTHA